MANLGLARPAMGGAGRLPSSFAGDQTRGPARAAHNNLGNVLRKSGRMDEALGHSRRAVELDAGDALARTNLGQMLLEGGLAEEALPHCEEAVRLLPQAAAICIITWGTRCASCRRYEEARSAYIQGMRLDPALAKGRRNWESCSGGEGRFDEAAVCLKRASRARPNRSGFCRVPRRLVGRPAGVARSDQLLQARDRHFAGGKSRAARVAGVGAAGRRQAWRSARRVPGSAADQAGLGHRFHSPGRVP